MKIRTGLDALLSSQTKELSRRSFGLLAHGASVTDKLVPAHLALEAAGCPPAALLAPEHGYYGVEQDMVASESWVDPLTGVPIHSLYGDSNRSLIPDEELFSALDLLLVDLQDVGCRYYTYAATGIWAAEVALAAGCEVWILDRPNPLGGVRVEGNLRRPGFESFVGAFEIPVRHGLTLGELALWVLGRDGKGSGLRVVPMTGWNRDMTWEATGRPWVAPSPNMPSPLTAWVYPGICLIEATSVSEGRGTTRPFQLVGAPHLDPRLLAQRLELLDLPGVQFLPTYFRPQHQKHAGKVCGGVEIIVRDANHLEPYRMGVEVLQVLHELSGPEPFWRREPYEFVSSIPAVDLLSGDSRLREALEKGGDPRSWQASWAEESRHFQAESSEVLLYPMP